MLFPFKFKKLNKIILKNSLTLNGLFSKNSIEFNNSVKYIRFGNFFKTSNFNRLNHTYNYIIDLRYKYNKVADIGVSDGSSSLMLVDNLKFNKFFFLDKFDKFKIKKNKNIIYIFDEKMNLHMVETKHLIYYLDPYKIYKNVFYFFISKIWREPIKGKLRTISFLNPIYQNHKKFNQIIYKNFDILNPKKNNIKFNLIFISNLLNKFHKNYEVLNIIKNNINSITENKGIVVIAENDNIERSTIYLKNDKNFNVIKRINGGSLTENYIKL